MARNWEEMFRSWGKPPSETERQKCENAETAIRKAVAASGPLSGRKIEVFAQGSYRNRTNVGLESDVDICVLCKDVCFADYSMGDGLTQKDVGLVDASYSYSTFKNEVGSALCDYFGRRSVTRGNKAFNIRENTYRVDADVVPCFEHSRYHRSADGSGFYYLSGTEFRPDNGGKVINWPQQNYDNGVAKNDLTNRRFKAVVRILKSLRTELLERTGEVPSFLIECLVWNVPNEGFGHDNYVADIRYALAHMFSETRTIEPCQEWGEVNELKYLLRGGQPWTREQAHRFADAAWDHIGFQ